MGLFRIFSVALLLTSALLGEAQADEADVPVTVLLRLLPGPCGNAESIIDRVQIRSSRISFVSADATHSVEVSTFEQPSGGVSGRVDFESATGTTLRRELSAATCAELIDGVGFVMAVVLDPPDAPSAGTNAGTPVPAEAAPEKQSDSSAATEPETATTTLRIPVTSEEPLAPSAPPRIRLGVGVQANLGLAPDWMPGATLLLSVALPSRFPAPFEAPGFVLGFAHSRSGLFDATGGAARFALTTGTIQLCPLSLSGSVLSASACVLAELGRVEAEGTRTREADVVSRPWALLGGSLLGTAKLGARLELGGQVGVGTPLVRDQFQFEPVVFHRIPPWAVQGMVFLTVSVSGE